MYIFSRVRFFLGHHAETYWSVAQIRMILLVSGVNLVA